MFDRASRKKDFLSHDSLVAAVVDVGSLVRATTAAAAAALINVPRRLYSSRCAAPHRCTRTSLNLNRGRQSNRVGPGALISALALISLSAPRRAFPRSLPPRWKVECLLPIPRSHERPGFCDLVHYNRNYSNHCGVSLGGPLGKNGTT